MSLEFAIVICNWAYTSIALESSLALNRRQAIISTNDILDYWRIYASFGIKEISFKCHSAIVALYVISRYNKPCYKTIPLY